MRSLSLRSRAALAAIPVLVLALGLVAYAVSQANYRGSVSALQTRMESYVYTVLAAMDVGPGGDLAVEQEFADPRLLQPGSGLFVQVTGEGIDWRSASALGADLPELGEMAAGQTAFREPADGVPYFIYQYGIGWQQDAER